MRIFPISYQPYSSNFCQEKHPGTDSFQALFAQYFLLLLHLSCAKASLALRRNIKVIDPSLSGSGKTSLSPYKNCIDSWLLVLNPSWRLKYFVISVFDFLKTKLYGCPNNTDSTNNNCLIHEHFLGRSKPYNRFEIRNLSLPLILVFWNVIGWWRFRSWLLQSSFPQQCWFFVTISFRQCLVMLFVSIQPWNLLNKQRLQ